MSIVKTVVLLSAATFAVAPAFTSAQARVHRHTAGHSVRVQQHINSASPGTTRALSPDSKQSATGGQPGGVVGQE